ncbi:MAG: transketolase family protein [Treponema sp.]|nr:transketolase family protein [Treponema sp.]
MAVDTLNKEMRNVLTAALREMMAADERIVVVDADLGRANGTLALRADFPDRAFDVGVAEQNMASLAAGMASCGLIPLIFTFTPFATRRICDQIAVSIAYAKNNVKIFGTDPGLAAELNGATHMSVEDVAVLRGIPGLVIFEPVDAVQLVHALPQIIACDSPVYIRLFRKILPSVFESGRRFSLFTPDLLREGKDVSIFASGIMVQESLKALELLDRDGISAELISVHTVKPLDEKTILSSAVKTGTVVTCENHSVIGGLGSAVAETLARNHPAPMRMIGIQDRFGQVGMLPYLKKEYAMTAEDIAAAAKDAVRAKKPD